MHRCELDVAWKQEVRMDPFHTMSIAFLTAAFLFCVGMLVLTV
jgi:hypothetical protein